MCHLEIFSPAPLFSSNPRLWHKKSYHIFSCGGSSLDPREKEEKGHLCGLGGLRFACLTSSWSYLSGTFWDWYSKAQFESSHSCTKAAIFWFLPSVSSPMGRQHCFPIANAKLWHTWRGVLSPSHYTLRHEVRGKSRGQHGSHAMCKLSLLVLAS